MAVGRRADRRPQTSSDRRDDSWSVAAQRTQMPCDASREASPARIVVLHQAQSTRTVSDTRSSRHLHRRQRSGASVRFPARDGTRGRTATPCWAHDQDAVPGRRDPVGPRVRQRRCHGPVRPGGRAPATRRHADGTLLRGVRADRLPDAGQGARTGRRRAWSRSRARAASGCWCSGRSWSTSWRSTGASPATASADRWCWASVASRCSSWVERRAFAGLIASPR